MRPRPAAFGVDAGTLAALFHRKVVRLWTGRILRETGRQSLLTDRGRNPTGESRPTLVFNRGRRRSHILQLGDMGELQADHGSGGRSA
jgi:hypothetical protein